ncbi:hypothetical protein OAK19_00225 [Aureispira]|nr:hypothetical protein [Aureispira sp.]
MIIISILIIIFGTLTAVYSDNEQAVYVTGGCGDAWPDMNRQGSQCGLKDIYEWEAGDGYVLNNAWVWTHFS